MSHAIEIHFESEVEEDFSLRWNVLDKTHALFWFKNLYSLIQKKAPSYYRFTGLNTKRKDLDVLSRELNLIIELLNATTPYQIEERADGTFSQEFANIIHHHFEMLFGDAHKPSELFKEATPMIRGAITKINHIIHDMEAFSRFADNDSANRGIIVEFLDRAQFKMPEEFLREFSLDIGFGDLALHYGIIGKSWWEVFLDEDVEIFPEAIRPLSFMSGEFDIQFSKFRTSQETKDDFFSFLQKHGLDRNDPSLCLGYLRLAELDRRGKSIEDIEKVLASYLKAKEIILFSDKGKILSKMKLDEDEMAEFGFFQVRQGLVLKQDSEVTLVKSPVQLIPVTGPVGGGVTLSSAPIFKRDWEPMDHVVCLMGMDDEAPVSLNPSPEILLAAKVSLGKGDILELAFDSDESRYIPIGQK